MRARVGSRTDIGRARQRNEDAFLVHERLFAVADGMGGHQAGEVASSTAMEFLEGVDLDTDGVMDALVQGVKDANDKVLERGEGDPALRGMGTTLTALVTDGEKAHVAHVGDSRAYLLRDGSLQQLTEDHTLVQRMVREGKLTPEEAQHHPQRSVVTRALGVEDDLRVDELTLPLFGDDRLLLCTDGLTGMLGEDRIHEILASASDPQAAADRLVEEANRAGGDDNITAIVVFVDDGSGSEGQSDGGTPSTAIAESDDPARAEAKGLVEREGHTAAMPAADRGEAEAEARPRRRRWVRVVVWLAVVAVVVTGGVLGARAYVNRQWYVGVSNEEVAIYNGVPTEVLGYRLSSPKELTGIPADEAVQFDAWKDLDEGITAASLDDARSIVEEIRSDLDRAASETV